MNNYIDLLQREYPFPYVKLLSETLSAGQQDIQFSSDRELEKGCHIIGAFIEQAAANRLSVNGRALMNDDAVQAAYLDLYSENGRVLQSIPLRKLYPTDSRPYLQLDFAANIDFTQTRIRIANTAALANEVIDLYFVWNDCTKHCVAHV